MFLSDLHLGTADNKAGEVVGLLKRVTCEKLVHNGDIIEHDDGRMELVRCRGFMVE